MRETQTYRQLALPTDLHTLQTLIPALDDLPTTEDERERFAGRVGIELLPSGELANVSHAEALAALGTGTFAEFDVFNDESGGEGALYVSKRYKLGNSKHSPVARAVTGAIRRMPGSERTRNETRS